MAFRALRERAKGGGVFASLRFMHETDNPSTTTFLRRPSTKIPTSPVFITLWAHFFHSEFQRLRATQTLSPPTDSTALRNIGLPLPNSKRHFAHRRHASKPMESRIHLKRLVSGGNRISTSYIVAMIAHADIIPLFAKCRPGHIRGPPP